MQTGRHIAEAITDANISKKLPHSKFTFSTKNLKNIKASGYSSYWKNKMKYNRRHFPAQTNISQESDLENHT